MRCHRCGTAVAGERVGVRAVCERCSAYLHCCRNCDFYAPGVANDCREPTAERVADKEQGNFCDHFRPPPAARTATDPTQTTRAQLAALFARKTDGKNKR
jgi:hypothetical protein